MIKIKTLYSVVIITSVLFLLYLCAYLINIATTSCLNISPNFVLRKPDIRINFVGDIMLDRGIYTHIEKNGFDSIFTDIAPTLDDADITVANLEGTVTNNKSISVTNNKILRFTFRPEYMAKLKKFNIGLVSLANNHSLDFGYDGFEKTKENLSSSTISFFGSAKNDDNIFFEKKIESKNICFLGYHDLFAQNPEIISKKIVEVRAGCDKIVVFTHWGNEYWNNFSDRQQILAHDFIDSGADLIIGSHPHVVQPIEIYKNKAIFYSLGNFIFDQNLSFATEHGLILNINFAQKNTSFKLFPTTIQNREIKLATSSDVTRILNVIVNNSDLDQNIKTSILDSSTFILSSEKVLSPADNNSSTNY